MAEEHDVDLEQALLSMKTSVRDVYEATHPARTPETCHIVCRWMTALGEMLWRGPVPPDRSDFRRFERFVTECMPDLAAECAAKMFPPTPSGRAGGVEWLFEVFRCYSGESGGLARRAELDDYWVETHPVVVLNVARLVAGFQEAAERFKPLASEAGILHTRLLDLIRED